MRISDRLSGNDNYEILFDNGDNIKDKAVMIINRHINKFKREVNKEIDRLSREILMIKLNKDVKQSTNI